MFDIYIFFCSLSSSSSIRSVQLHVVRFNSCVWLFLLMAYGVSMNISPLNVFISFCFLQICHEIGFYQFGFWFAMNWSLVLKLLWFRIENKIDQIKMEFVYTCLESKWTHVTIRWIHTRSFKLFNNWLATWCSTNRHEFFVRFYFATMIAYHIYARNLQI